MRVAAVDPGYNTGLAIGEMQHNAGLKKVRIEKYILSTVEAKWSDGAVSVSNIVLASRCGYCIMERRPQFPSEAGRVHYEQILHELCGGSEFVEAENLQFVSKGNLRLLYLIGPGIWKKPVEGWLKKQPDLFSPWCPETQHEIDAMSLLFYWTKIHNPEWRIEYV